MTRNPLPICIALCLFAFLGGVVGQRLFVSPAWAQGAPAPAAKVGLVNLRKLFMGYQKTRAKEKEIQAKYRKIEAQLKARIEALEAQKARLSNYKKDDPIYRTKLARLAEQYDEVKGKLEWGKRALSVEMRRATEEIFGEIIAEVAAYGKANGYQLILKHDDDDIRSSSDAELKVKLAQKQVLYHPGSIDLTQEIARRLAEKHR